jgi:hypothetical protein
MGKLINGINGPIQGTVGTVVGSSWKGVPYLKAKYKKRKKKITPNEKGNRNKFADSQFWLQPVLGFVREGFKGYTERVEGFIAAKSYLSKNAFEGEAPNIRINPALVQVSFGSLPLSNDITVERLGEWQLQFSWDPADVDGGHRHDQVMMLAYDIENKHAYSTTTGQFRNAGSDTLNIPPVKGRTYHLYCAFNGVDRKSQSHSVYLGAITI